METRTYVVADDLPAIRCVMERTLAGPGVMVISVGNGRMACEAADLASPDVVILDLCMPEMDGLAACARLRSAKKTRDIPILMITAAGDPEEGMSAADDWLAKPFELSEFKARVERLTALGRRRRAEAGGFHG